MSFIIKLKATTTLPPTTTQSPTTTVNTVNISNNNVFISAFGAGNGNSFGNGESPFAIAFGNDGSERAGDINMRIISNNSDYIDNGDGTYDLNLNIVGRISNTSQNSRNVVIPRIGINLGFIATNFIKAISSFIPIDSSKRVGLVTQDRMVAEFDDINLTSGQIKNYSLVGTVRLSRVGTRPPIVDLSITDDTVPTLRYNINKPANVPTYTLTTRDIAGLASQHSENIKTIQNDSSLIIGNTYNFPDPNFLVAHAIRLKDGLTPDFLLVNNKRNGFILNASKDIPTTTTTTLAPTGTMSFTSSNISNEEITPTNPVPSVEFTIRGSGDLNPIPFRVRVITDRSELSFSNVIEDTGGDKENLTFVSYVNGEVVIRDSISPNTNYNTIGDIFFIADTGTGTIEFALETATDGINYIETDRISFTLTKKQVLLTTTSSITTTSDSGGGSGGGGTDPILEDN